MTTAEEMFGNRNNLLCWRSRTDKNVAMFSCMAARDEPRQRAYAPLSSVSGNSLRFPPGLQKKLSDALISKFHDLSSRPTRLGD